MRFFGLLVIGGIAFAGEARADTCVRPSDAGGYAGYVYSPSTVRYFDSKSTRVHYVDEGKHSVRTKSSRPDSVPDDVARVAEIAEDALTRYGTMGYRSPRSDVACGSNGGDGRLDVYLVDFGAADGMTARELCSTEGKVTVCASFLLVESNFEGRYATADEGIRTVVPHELFHAVQNAYDADLDRFWAEGTAQWAAKRLDPTLLDLERFLPSYFGDTGRALDAPAGGVTAGFLYGSAIWPVYLTEKHADETVRLIFETEASSGAGIFASTDEVLKKNYSSSLASEFTTFALFNAATSTRTGTGGYASAKSYPAVKIDDLPEQGVSGATSGLATKYFRVQIKQGTKLEIDADPARTRAIFLPLEDGKARIDHATPLPADVNGEGIAVVAGITTKKTDADFRLYLTATSTPGSATAPPVTPSTDPVIAPSQGGCSISESESHHTLTPLGLLALAFVFESRSRKRAERSRSVR